MPVTWTKLEEYTGTRTVPMPDPDNEGETINSEVSCRDIRVEFTDGDVTHVRYVNVSVDEEGEYDEADTDLRIAEVANGVANKIRLGVIS